MTDPVRLSDGQSREIYPQAYETWFRISRHTAQEPQFPRSALFPAVSQDHPLLPCNLDLKYETHGIFATGTSTWTSSSANCSTTLPPFKQSLEAPVTASAPTPVSIAESNEHEEPYAQFTGRHNCYLSLLVLAWSYVLSARWTEVMSKPSTVTYKPSSLAQLVETNDHRTGQNAVEISLLDADTAEIRWWAAILAPGQGWEAQMETEHGIYMSPWSVSLQTHRRFALRHSAGELPLSHPALSSRDARRYLDRFCIDRNIIDQSHAALSAVLLLPCFGGTECLNLPFPDIVESKTQCPPQDVRPIDGTDFQLCWTHDDQQMDRLLTLSCNIAGVRAMLLSTFYEPSIECNAVDPWLQGTVTALARLGQSDPHKITRMCMERAPAIAFLWLGVFVLDLHQTLINGVRCGYMPIDLNSAAWSHTIQSFIQCRQEATPTSKDGAATAVLRADECKLLFLSQSGLHARLPVCPWRPFGATAIQDTDLIVRMHASCANHQLRYTGGFWDCKGGIQEFPLPAHDGNEHKCGNTECEPRVKAYDPIESVSIPFEGLDQAREGISADETRKVISWLRCDGYPQAEADIRKHEWFDLGDSDDGEMADDPRESHYSSDAVTIWLLNIDGVVDGDVSKLW